MIRLDNESEISTIEALVEDSAQNLKPMLAKIEEQLGKKMSKRSLQWFLEKNRRGNVFEKKHLKNLSQKNIRKSVNSWMY
ncbi:MAG: hypothetical protein ACI976_002235 [Aureispira sp.]|jgi:hypothetical protein